MSGRQGTGEKERRVSESPFGEVIAAYTRKDAIEDGVLLDVSETAKELGICYPVCLTRAVWNRYVRVPECVAGIQDESGRLFDILWMFCYGSQDSEDDELLFKLHVANEPGPAKPVTLKAVCGPSDDGSLPVLTIMLPDED